MFDFSPIQIIIVLVIALLVFGPKRLPEMGRNLGRSMREFKNSISGDSRSDIEVEPDVDLVEKVAQRQEPPAPTPEIAAAEIIDERAEAEREREAVGAARENA